MSIPLQRIFPADAMYLRSGRGTVEAQGFQPCEISGIEKSGL
jgi:hypothetical protein